MAVHPLRPLKVLKPSQQWCTYWEPDWAGVARSAEAPLWGRITFLASFGAMLRARHVTRSLMRRYATRRTTPAYATRIRDADARRSGIAGTCMVGRVAPGDRAPPHASPGDGVPRGRHG
eukprot:3678974-Prymnesium_polylepis.1